MEGIKTKRRMKKIILSLIFAASVVASFAQSGAQQFSGVFYRVNDSTTYQTAAAAKHSAGYADIYFNNQATTPHFDIWNGSSYDHIFNFASGGSFTLTDGNLTTANATAVDQGGTQTGDIQEDYAGFNKRGTGDYLRFTQQDNTGGFGFPLWGRAIFGNNDATIADSVDGTTRLGASKINADIIEHYVEHKSTGELDVVQVTGGDAKFIHTDASSNQTMIGVQDNGFVVQVEGSTGSNGDVVKKVAGVWTIAPDGGGLGTVTSVASADGSITVTNGTTTPDLAVVRSPILTTGRTIGIATGDVTSSGSSFNGSANNTNAYTLATVNSNVGSFGSGTEVGTFTVNAKGLITAASNTTITPSALGAWALTGTSTGTGAMTIVNPTVNGLRFTNTFTTTASDQHAVSEGGTITPRPTASDNIYGRVFDYAIDQKANGQSLFGLQVNTPLTNTGAFSTTGSVKTYLLVGTKTVGTHINPGQLIATGQMAIGSSSSPSLIIANGGSQVELGPSITSTAYQFTITNASATTSTGGVVYLRSIIGNAASNGGSYYGINAIGAFTNNWSNTSNFYGIHLTNGFAPTGSSSTANYFYAAPVINATGGTTTVRFADWNPTETSLTGVSNYGVTIGGAALSGFGTRTPTERVDIVGNLKFSGALMPNNTAGTSGQLLQSAGAGSPPTWTGTPTLTSLSTPILTTTGSFHASITLIATDLTLDNTNHTVVVDASSASRTITLPTAVSAHRRIYVIKKADNVNNVVIDGNGSETIDGATTQTLTTQYQSITIQSDGSFWWIIAESN